VSVGGNLGGTGANQVKVLRPPIDEMAKNEVIKNFGWKNRNFGLKTVIRIFGSRNKKI